MRYLKQLLMLVVPAVVLNVWLLRYSKATPYRGGDASTMLEEFTAYGLSESMVFLVGGLKILAALGLLLGFKYKKAIVPSATIIALLMVGAIAMHFKVGDQALKFLPAGLMLIGSAAILWVSKKEA